MKPEVQPPKEHSAYDADSGGLPGSGPDKKIYKCFTAVRPASHVVGTGRRKAEKPKHVYEGSP